MIDDSHRPHPLFIATAATGVFLPDAVFMLGSFLTGDISYLGDEIYADAAASVNAGVLIARFVLTTVLVLVPLGALRGRREAV